MNQDPAPIPVDPSVVIDSLTAQIAQRSLEIAVRDSRIAALEAEVATLKEVISEDSGSEPGTVLP